MRLKWYCFPNYCFEGPKSRRRPVTPVMQGRFSFRQNFQFDRLKCKLNAPFHKNVFRANGLTPDGGIPIFPFQPVKTEIPVPFGQIQSRPAAGTCNFSRHFQSVSVVHGKPKFFTSYLTVQNDICTSDARTLRRFKLLISCWQKLKQDSRRNCPKEPRCYRHLPC